MSKANKLPRERSFFLRLLRLEEKLLLRHLPAFLGQTLCLLLLFGAVSMIAMHMLPEEKSPISIRIAVVVPESNDKTNIMLQLVSSAADLPSILELELTDSDTAVRMIRSNQAAGAILFPDGFIEAAMYGKEMELQILLPQNSGAESFLFDDLAHTAVTMLLDIQNGCYAAHEAAAVHGLEYAYDDNGDEIAKAYVKTVFSRLDYFDEQSIRATGSQTPVQYYGGVALLLLLLLSGISFGPLFSWQNKAFHQKMQIQRLHPLLDALIPLLAISGYFAFLLVLILGIAACIPAADGLVSGLNLTSVLNLAVICLTSAAFISAVYRLFRSRAATVMLLFLGSILMVFLAGGLIPSVYLPVSLTAAVPFLPVTPLLKAFGCCFTGVFAPLITLWASVWGIGFYLLSAAAPLLYRGAEGRGL